MKIEVLMNVMLDLMLDVNNIKEQQRDLNEENKLTEGGEKRNK